MPLESQGHEILPKSFNATKRVPGADPNSRQPNPPRPSPRTYDPSTSMKMKVFLMLVVCFFQELQSSSSFLPMSSRVEAAWDASWEGGKEDRALSACFSYKTEQVAKESETPKS